MIGLSVRPHCLCADDGEFEGWAVILRLGPIALTFSVGQRARTVKPTRPARHG